MKTVAPALALMLLAAPAAAFTPERAGMMVDAIRANGCSMTGDEADGALAPLGLNGVEVQAFVDTLYGAELVTLSDDMNVLSLSEALCAAEAEASMALIVAAFEAQESSLEPWRPEFAPERGAEFIGAIRGANCALTEADAEAVLSPLSFDPSESRDIVTVLIEGGLAQISEDGQTLSLTEALCAADATGDAPAIAEILANWDETHPAAEIHVGTEGDQ